jgi:hypothetical protein
VLRRSLSNLKWSGVGASSFLTFAGTWLGALYSPFVSHIPGRVLIVAKYRVGGAVVGLVVGLVIMLLVRRCRVSLLLLFELVLSCGLVAYEIAHYLRVAQVAKHWGL